MSLSALTKFILPPVLASAAVFSTMTVPLAMIGDKQININFQEEPLFFGKLRDVALPYVVVATGLSLGAGISAAALSGWRNSARKSTQIEEQLAQLEQQLQQKEELLKEFKLSETRLQVSGLNNFLDEQTSSLVNRGYPTLNSSNAPQANVAQIPQPANHQPVIQANTKDTTPANAASMFASAQTFLGYAQSSNRSSENINKEIAHLSQVSQNGITAIEFEQLQRQLKDMMLQMQAMQNNLPVNPQSVNAVQTPQSETISIYYDNHKPQQVQFG